MWCALSIEPKDFTDYAPAKAMKDRNVKKFVSGIVLLACLAGCSSSENLPVRNGPQEIHPSDWQRMQNGAVAAPS